MNFSADELQDAFLRDQTYLQRNSTLQWAKEFLLDLHRARKKEDLLYVSWGFGTGYRVYGIDLQFQHLNCEVVVQAFKDARSPVLFFDHEVPKRCLKRFINSECIFSQQKKVVTLRRTSVGHSASLLCRFLGYLGT